MRYRCSMRKTAISDLSVMNKRSKRMVSIPKNHLKMRINLTFKGFRQAWMDVVNWRDK